MSGVTGRPESGRGGMRSWMSAQRVPAVRTRIAGLSGSAGPVTPSVAVLRTDPAGRQEPVGRRRPEWGAGVAAGAEQPPLFSLSCYLFCARTYGNDGRRDAELLFVELPERSDNKGVPGLEAKTYARRPPT